jgi:hypothetical protein
MVPCQSEEEEPWDGSDLSIWFQEFVSIFQAGVEGLSKIYFRSFYEMFISWGTLRQANSDPNELV